MASIEDLTKDFSKLLKENKLSHSYLLFGPSFVPSFTQGFGGQSKTTEGKYSSGEEKILFAKELANFLENKKWPPRGDGASLASGGAISERPLIDALIIDARNDFGIDVVRSATNFLWQKPAASSRRTLIINGADFLTLPAQNAILKIAEEPPGHALLLLMVRDPAGLLPAVQSRFQKIYVHANSKFLISNFKTNPKFQISKFIKATTAEKREILKNLVDSEKKKSGVLEDFVTALMAELKQDPIRNFQMLKNLLERWALINQFNVNKRLQLEAALL